MPREVTGDASLAVELARGVDSGGGERPRGEEELGTGWGLEGDDVFLWPDIEPEYKVLPGHVLFNFAQVERSFHLIV